ncbi:hypothetical protein ACF0H5_000874 [Mactra antiquata]
METLFYTQIGLFRQTSRGDYCDNATFLICASFIQRAWVLPVLTNQNHCYKYSCVTSIFTTAELGTSKGQRHFVFSLTAKEGISQVSPYLEVY